MSLIVLIIRFRTPVIECMVLFSLNGDSFPPM